LRDGHMRLSDLISDRGAGALPPTTNPPPIVPSGGADEIPKERGVCSHCGALMVEYKSTLRHFHVIALRIMAAQDKPISMTKPMKDADFDRSWMGNMYRLKHWGLAREWRGTEDAAKWRGYWEITDAGRAFLKGMPVPRYAVTYRTRVVRYEGVMVTADFVVSKLGRKEEPTENYEHFRTQAAAQIVGVEWDPDRTTPVAWDPDELDQYWLSDDDGDPECDEGDPEYSEGGV